jgi:threonine dehydratase
MENQFVTKKQIEEAAERIKDYKHVTPLLTCDSINKEAGCTIYFKCENF